MTPVPGDSTQILGHPRLRATPLCVTKRTVDLTTALKHTLACASDCVLESN